MTSLSWRDYVRGRKTFRKKERKRQKCSKAVVTEPLFSTHCLRFATMHTKHNKEWLKQTQGKQIRTRYSSWLSSFVLPSLHVICFFQFGFFFLIFLSKIKFCFSVLLSTSFYLCTLRELIRAGQGWWTIGTVQYWDVCPPPGHYCYILSLEFNAWWNKQLFT